MVQDFQRTWSHIFNDCALGVSLWHEYIAVDLGQLGLAVTHLVGRESAPRWAHLYYAGYWAATIALPVALRIDSFLRVMVTFSIILTAITLDRTDSLGPCSPTLRKDPNYKLWTNPSTACFSLFISSIRILCKGFFFKFLKHLAFDLSFKGLEEG